MLLPFAASAMPALAPTAPPPLLRVQFAPAVEMTDEQFFQLCQQNRDLRLERTSKGELIVMAPASSATGHRNLKIAAQLDRWAEKDGAGLAFDSSSGFDLPDGSIRAPDAAWVRRERLAKLSKEEKKGFFPLCPDFLVELRSPSDPRAGLQEKMRKYVENGLRLGWLIDPQTRQVTVYRPDADPDTLDHPDEVRGAPVLEGFTLNLDAIWTPDL
jgi:Uma2 family endonuclease